MSVECKNCKKLVDPIFKMDAGIDCHVCPECRSVMDGCTDSIQVIGRDM